jgi:hypothetical protein
MNRTFVTLAGTLVAVMSIMPVSAYHIKPVPGLEYQVNVVTGTVGEVANIPGDWILDNPLLLLCESMGAHGVRNENAISIPGVAMPPLTDPTASASIPLPGIGGLCTTGRNELTGPATDIPAALPGVSDWTKLDVCDSAYVVPALANVVMTPRTVGGSCKSGSSLSIPEVVTNVVAPGSSMGTTTKHGYTATIGAFSCFIPTDGALLAPYVRNDYALYYSERYAWWSYDGDGDYSTPAEEAAYHGHVSVFVDPTASKLGASLLGSVETSAMSGRPTNTIEGFSTLGGLTPLNPEDLDSGCGGSPASTGPVVRAPSDSSVMPSLANQCLDGDDNDGDGSIDALDSNCPPLGPGPNE